MKNEQKIDNRIHEIIDEQKFNLSDGNRQVDVIRSRQQEKDICLSNERRFLESLILKG